MAELPGYDDALARALAEAAALGEESVAIDDAAGRVLRDDVTADRDQPPFNRSAMDGFAVRASAWDPGKRFRIAGAVPAGGVLDPGLVIDAENDVVRIATGAAVPDIFDAVVPIERAAVDDKAGTVRFESDGKVPGVGAAVHPRGADAAAGGVVLSAGTVLKPHHLGIAATVGAVALNVTRRPRVVVLSSGDEVRPVETSAADLPAQAIRNSNGAMLVALLAAMGAEVVRHEHVVDEADAVEAACRSAALDADLVVTAGGVSVGTRDLFPATWPRLGYETVLHGVAMQPGKPVFVARLQESSEAKPRAACVLGLPGNPVSVWATAHLFLWPVVRRMLGLASGESSGGALPWRRVWLASPTKANTRREAFRAARFVGQTREQVEVIPWRGSGDLIHTAAAEGLLRLPIHAGEIPAGAGLSFLPVLGGDS